MSVRSFSEVSKVLFVCTGNSCRSVMAERLFAQIAFEKNVDIKAASAGISGLSGGPASPETLDLLSQVQVDASDHRSQGLSESLVDQADIIFAMTKIHENYLKDNFPQSQGKVRLLSEFYDGENKHQLDMGIPDPIGMGKNFYSNVFKIIQASIHGWFDSVKQH